MNFETSIYMLLYGPVMRPMRSASKEISWISGFDPRVTHLKLVSLSFGKTDAPMSYFVKVNYGEVFVRQIKEKPEMVN